MSLIRDAAWTALSAVLAVGIWLVLAARRVCRACLVLAPAVLAVVITLAASRAHRRTAGPRPPGRRRGGSCRRSATKTPTETCGGIAPTQ